MVINATRIEKLDFLKFITANTIITSQAFDD